jgi:hypothetical protein
MHSVFVCIVYDINIGTPNRYLRIDTMMPFLHLGPLIQLEFEEYGRCRDPAINSNVGNGVLVFDELVRL